MHALYLFVFLLFGIYHFLLNTVLFRFCFHLSFSLYLSHTLSLIFFMMVRIHHIFVWWQMKLFHFMKLISCRHIYLFFVSLVFRRFGVFSIAFRIVMCSVRRTYMKLLTYEYKYVMTFPWSFVPIDHFIHIVFIFISYMWFQLHYDTYCPRA